MCAMAVDGEFQKNGQAIQPFALRTLCSQSRIFDIRQGGPMATIQIPIVLKWNGRMRFILDRRNMR